jgi:hypothetical protein
MSRVWALRLTFVSLGLLACLFILRDTILDGLAVTGVIIAEQPWTYHLAAALLEQGWGFAVLACAALYGIYRAIIARP